MISAKPISSETIQALLQACISIQKIILWLLQKIAWRRQQIIWKIISLISWDSRKSHCQVHTSSSSKWTNITSTWSNSKSCKRSTTAAKRSKLIRIVQRVWIEETMNRNRNYSILRLFYREIRVKPRCKLKMEMMNRLSTDVSWTWALNIKRSSHHSRSRRALVHQWRLIIIHDLTRVILTQK